MKRTWALAVIAALCGCEDSGPVPFSGPELFGSGGTPAGSGSSCYGQCGSSSPRPSGCSCDSNCANRGDCCLDYVTYCGGSSCATYWQFSSAVCDDCMRKSCCVELQDCDSGTVCRKVDQCHSLYCAGAGDVVTCMNTYCTMYGDAALETWFSYSTCMTLSCKLVCST